MSKPFLSVIIPAYNESANVATKDLFQAYTFLRQQTMPFEMLLVDDGSTDGTLEKLNQFRRGKPEVTVLAQPHQGKGPTVKAGMLAARGKWRLFTDFDQSTPIQEVTRLLEYAQDGYQVVIGSREVQGAAREAEPWYRHLMGRAFNLVVQFLAVRGIQDTQCGFKLFSSRATKELFPKLQVMQPSTGATPFTGAFDVELLFLARKHGFDIKEVPVTWKHVKTDRVSPVRDSVKMFIEVAKIRWLYLQGKYA